MKGGVLGRESVNELVVYQGLKGNVGEIRLSKNFESIKGVY